ncbi:MAG: helix-turn-helix transcriptional regulator [Defluviimonas sp.]|uniref:ArsR/SmtB family transcription factor n=1 Tax=Albidovulum sp. TaxID=1872424 RepID=UPI002A327C90|nr:helix-turn-helix transcriptional regulator [Defluviimonas sp.]
MPNDIRTIDRTFGALADPTRRAVVQALCKGPATVSELAVPFAMALPSFTQHLGVLEGAGLIVSRREGRTRICSLNPESLHSAEAWLARHRCAWEARMDRFEAHLERSDEEPRNE